MRLRTHVVGQDALNVGSQIGGSGIGESTKRYDVLRGLAVLREIPVAKMTVARVTSVQIAEAKLGGSR